MWHSEGWAATVPPSPALSLRSFFPNSLDYLLFLAQVILSLVRATAYPFPAA